MFSVLPKNALDLILCVLQVVKFTFHIWTQQIFNLLFRMYDFEAYDHHKLTNSNVKREFLNEISMYLCVNPAQYTGSVY